MMKRRWQKVVHLDYSFPFFTAIVKHVLAHQLYSSKEKKFIETLLQSSDPTPQRCNTRLSNIYDSSRPLSLHKQH